MFFSGCMMCYIHYSTFLYVYAQKVGLTVFPMVNYICYCINFHIDCLMKRYPGQLYKSDLVLLD